jgi:hypothetical protein
MSAQALGYEVPPPRDQKGSQRQFLLALAIGTAASAFTWIVAWGSLAGVYFMVLVPLAKLFIGIELRRRPPWKGFGAGLLASLAVGFLIFFSVCAANFRIQS